VRKDKKHHLWKEPPTYPSLSTTWIDTWLRIIAYLTDPADNTWITNCVVDYPRFTTSTTARMIVGREALYDAYDKKNDDEATQYLLNSLDGKLSKNLITACQGIFL
jgi:hypothetical protein